MSGPSALAPALSLQGVGKEYRLYASPRQRLRAVLFTDEQAELLGVAPRDAGLLIERRGVLKDGRAVEVTQSYYRGDAYDFVAELNAL